jgi:hypothetical protein
MNQMSFAQAAARFNGSSTNLGTTTNGAATNLTTHSACVDFFGQAPAMRGKSAQAKFLFDKAYAENQDLALRTLLWLRDVRGGAGERQLFRDLVQHLSSFDPTNAGLIALKTPEVGRWDDLFAFGGETRSFALFLLDHALLGQNDRLAAKWMPRKGTDAEALRKAMGLTPRQYRKVIVGLSDTVEQKMCAKDWAGINFSHVPSVAAKQYQKAFGRNATEAYAAYKAALVKGDGTSKVNAGAIFPHDVISGLKYGDDTVAEAQWKALPDFLGSDEGIIPLCDLSGSMDSKLGQNPKTTVSCRHVAEALGLYIAERQTGAFHNLVMTFSTQARVVTLSDTMSLTAKLRKLDDGYMGSTNIEAAFTKILEIAVQNKVAPEAMPKRLLILSDMEFDAATGAGGYGYTRHKTTAMDMARKAYAKAGYAMPTIVFWNLNARLGNNPVTIKDDGSAMVAGYSPAILKAILSGKTTTPEEVMLNAIMGDRYNYRGV